MNKSYVVYVHINKVNGKKYYGITCQRPEIRWRNGDGYSHNKYFTNSIKKYGWGGFNHKIIARGLTEDEAKWLEIEMIEAHNTNNPEYGYNLTKGGDDGNGLKGEKHPNYGKHLSEEIRNKISESHKGKGKSKNAANAKPVICITTKRVFYTAKDAADYYSLDNSTIAKCCRGKRHYHGKLNGQPLVWKFLNYKHNNAYRIA